MHYHDRAVLLLSKTCLHVNFKMKAADRWSFLLGDALDLFS